VGDLLLHKPRAYQQKVGQQQEIAAHYIQRGTQTVGIEVASYDASQPLIIDPVLGYSTYLGGTANQQLNGIAADATGFAYVTGATTSANFPTTAGSLQTTKSNPSSNAFITKLKQDGSGLVYSTFLGGTGASGDGATSIAVDASGDAYIVGTTSSTDFPITPGSAFQTTNKGTNGFFTELAPTGSSLLYSTDRTRHQRQCLYRWLDHLYRFSADLFGGAKHEQCDHVYYGLSHSHRPDQERYPVADLFHLLRWIDSRRSLGSGRGFHV
jgi:hypothetical protein